MASYNLPITDLGQVIGPLRTRLQDLEGLVFRSAQAPWIAPTLLNSFGEVLSGYAPIGYFRDAFGVVRLRGRLTIPEGAGSDETIFTLAEGYRPAYIHEFVVVSGEFEGSPVWARVKVQTDGDVSYTGQLAEQAPLDTVAFRTF